MIIQCPIDNVPMALLARSAAGKVFECPRCKNRSSLKTEELAALGEEVGEREAEKPQVSKEPELPTPQMSKEEQQERAQHVYQEGTTAEEIELSKSGQSDNWNKAIGTLAKILELPLSVVNDRVRAPREDETVAADLTIDEIEGCAHEKTHRVEDREICDLCGVDLEEGWEETDTVQPDVVVEEDDEWIERPDGGFITPDGRHVDFKAFDGVGSDRGEPAGSVEFAGSGETQAAAEEKDEISHPPIVEEMEGIIPAEETEGLEPGTVLKVDMKPVLHTREELLSALADLNEQDEKEAMDEKKAVDLANLARIKEFEEKQVLAVKKKKSSRKPKSRRKKKARKVSKRKKVKSVAKD